MREKAFLILLAFGATACASIPTGPTVMVLPGQGKPFEQFQAEDGLCRQWAAQEAGITPEQIANQPVVTGAAVGTVLGAGLGAAIGAASGNPGIGAAIGAGSGLLVGTGIGYGESAAAVGSVQWRYDIAFEQCMYAKGNQIPVNVAPYRTTASTPPPPPPSSESAPAPK